MEMRSQLCTLVILIQRKNRDGRLGASQDQADCIEGGKKFFLLMEIDLQGSSQQLVSILAALFYLMSLDN
jgi:hypothetical protein